MARLDNATGWRRRALRLVDLCMKLDAEHVLYKAMRRWPVAALLEATEGWSAQLFAAVCRDWRLKKVARLLEAKGRSFIVECCEEWEPEFLQVLLPELDLVVARHVLGRLYFKSEDRHLSAWECRCIVEAFPSRAQRKLLRKFDDQDVSRVMNATESEDSAEGRDGDEEDEDEDDSMDGFLVRDGEEGEEEVEGSEEEDGEEEDGEEGEEDSDGDEEMVDGEVQVGSEEDDDEEEDDEDGDDDEDEEEEDGEAEEGEEWGSERVEEEEEEPVHVGKKARLQEKEKEQEAFKKELTARVRAATAAVAAAAEAAKKKAAATASEQAPKSGRKGKRAASARN